MTSISLRSILTSSDLSVGLPRVFPMEYYWNYENFKIENLEVIRFEAPFECLRKINAQHKKSNFVKEQVFADKQPSFCKQQLKCPKQKKNTHKDASMEYCSMCKLKSPLELRTDYKYINSFWK